MLWRLRGARCVYDSLCHTLCCIRTSDSGVVKSSLGCAAKWLLSTLRSELLLAPPVAACTRLALSPSLIVGYRSVMHAKGALTEAKNLRQRLRDAEANLARAQQERNVLTRCLQAGNGGMSAAEIRTVLRHHDMVGSTGGGSVVGDAAAGPRQHTRPPSIDVSLSSDSDDSDGLPQHRRRYSTSSSRRAALDAPAGVFDVHLRASGRMEHRRPSAVSSASHVGGRPVQGGEDESDGGDSSHEDDDEALQNLDRLATVARRAGLLGGLSP